MITDNPKEHLLANTPHLAQLLVKIHNFIFKC